MYLRAKDLRSIGMELTQRNKDIMRIQTTDQAIATWKSRIQRNTGYGKRVREAIAPHIEEWILRTNGRVCYHMTQVLMGHGCFADYLHRIGKMKSRRCAHCATDIDNAQHTCSTWEAERRELTSSIGDDLSLNVVIKNKYKDSNSNWEAFSKYCQKVMMQKEEAERAQQAMTRVLPPQVSSD